MADYGTAVEQWRPHVLAALSRHGITGSQAQAAADKALYTLKYESGGRADAIGDAGVAIGLFQIQSNERFPDRPAATWLLNPLNNIAYAVDTWIARGDWSAWGEGVLYQGRVFGALGNHPYPGYDGASNVAVADAPPGSGGPGWLPDLPDWVPVPDLPDWLGGAATGAGVGVVGGPVGVVGGAVGGGALDALPGVNIPNPLDALKGLTAPVTNIAGFFEQLVKVVTWLLDPHHWARAFFILAGSALILTGVLLYFRGTEAGKTVEGLARTAATKGAA
jgi:hypothetical protein